MDARRLKYFVAVYEGRNITHAAEACGVAQSAVSQQLGLLERELELKLFERLSQGVRPTAAAHRLYRHSLGLLRDLDDLKRIAQQPDGDRQVVSIGLPPTSVLTLGIDLIEQVRSKHPDILLQIVEDRSEALARHVDGGRLSLAVVSHHTLPTLEHTLVANERMVCVAPASWRMPDRMTLAELGDVPMVLPCRPHSIRALVDTAFAAAGIAPSLAAELDSVALLRGAVSAGVGASVLPAQLFHGPWREGVRISLLEKEIYRTMLLCTPREPQWRDAERDVIEILKALLARPVAVQPGPPPVRSA